MIYFAREENGPIKIGFTSGEAAGRLSDLQTGNSAQLHVMATVVGDKQVEKALHSRFSHLRIRGEWFRPELELTCFIDGLAWALPATDIAESRYEERAAPPPTALSSALSAEVAAIMVDGTWKHRELMRVCSKVIAQKALDACNGNVSKAATLLGLSREGVYGAIASSAYYQSRRANWRC